MGTTESILGYNNNNEPTVSGGGGSRRPSTAPGRSAPANPPPNLPLLKMAGVVLGMSQSGKQTLLARLEGKDPFVDNMDDHSERAATIVPFLTKAQVWDRIQLQIQVSRSVSQKQQQQQHALDFAVILINPTHDKSRLRDYLTQTIPDLLRLQGYSLDDASEDCHANDNDQRPQRPFCLCLLLNFRDRKTKKWLEPSDVQALMLQLLQDVPMEPSSLVLQCGHASLQNCFGLDLLHHFIYQAYLQRKQWELQQQLNGIHRAVVQANATTPRTSYDDFLQRLHPTTATVTTAPARPDASRKDAERQAAGQIEPPKTTVEVESRRSSSSYTTAAAAIPSRSLRRNIMDPHTSVSSRPTESRVSQPSAVDVRAALEAFLASDSSEDDNVRRRRRPRPPKASHKKGGRRQCDDDDDDDESNEDEFFYDERGQRQSLQASNGEEDGSRRQVSSRKHKGPRQKARSKTKTRTKKDEDTTNETDATTIDDIPAEISVVESKSDTPARTTNSSTSSADEGISGTTRVNSAIVGPQVQEEEDGVANVSAAVSEAAAEADTPSHPTKRLPAPRGEAPPASTGNNEEGVMVDGEWQEQGASTSQRPTPDSESRENDDDKEEDVTQGLSVNVVHDDDETNDDEECFVGGSQPIPPDEDKEDDEPQRPAAAVVNAAATTPARDSSGRDAAALPPPPSSRTVDRPRASTSDHGSDANGLVTTSSLTRAALQLDPRQPVPSQAAAASAAQQQSSSSSPTTGGGHGGGGGGLSTAALAAIAAAQEQAELMPSQLPAEEDSDERDEPRPRPKGKRKSADKKKKSSKRSTAGEVDSSS